MYTVHCTGTSTVAVVVHSNCPYTQEQSLYTLYNRRRHTRHRSSYPAATVIHSNCPYTQESNRYIHFTTGGAIHGICSHNQQLLLYTAIVVIKNKYNSGFICCYTHQLYVNKISNYIYCLHTLQQQLSSYRAAVLLHFSCRHNVTAVDAKDSHPSFHTPLTAAAWTWGWQLRHFTPR